METERSPLSRTSFPRYTFLRNGNFPKRNAGRLKCCCWTTALILIVVALVMLLSYFLTLSYTNGNPQELDGLTRLQWPLQEEKYTNISMDLQNETKAIEIGSESLENRDSLEDILPSIPIDSPEFRHSLATPTTKRAQEMSRLGFVLNVAAKEMNKGRNKSQREDMKMRWKNTQLTIPSVRCMVSSYRSVDGTCNNLEHPTWGAALQPFRRILLPNYADGILEPRKASDGSDLPSPREISLSIHRPAYQNDMNFTVMLAVWGQFIDHDVTSTAINKGKNGDPIKCCGTEWKHPECFPVLIGRSDPFYSKYNVSCMEFVRSAPAPTEFYGPREQLNQVTSYLDGSVVYGNDLETMNELRTFTGGELKMLNTPAGDLLPVSLNLNDGCNRQEEFAKKRYCFLSGDNRSNENLLLTSMHLLFARHHNQIARNLSKLNPHWMDERIFQETRKIVGAQIQHITYNEFLTSILPERLMEYLNISSKSREYDLYNSSIDATIANVFASAAFRFGHSLLPGLIRFLNNNATHKEYIELHKMLFNQFDLFDKEYLEGILNGAMNTSSSKCDIHFTSQITQKLFQTKPISHPGLDLVSLNIQRGRDHGLPSYPYWRKVCGLEKPEDFNDLQNDIDNDTLSQLSKLYKSINDVDLYTGGLSERPVAGGLLGPTMTCLIADQFLRLKIGDRFWYERKETYTNEQVKQIKRTTLAGVICGTSGVSAAQPNVMRRTGRNNELIPCNEIPVPDLEPWKEL